MKPKILKKNKTIWLAGHRGLVGKSILSLLKKNQYNVIFKTSKQLDLRNFTKVKNFLKKNMPDQIIISAGNVGGILANKNEPINFYYDNLTIGNNIIKAAYELKIKNLLYLGSSCIYPKNIKRKILESDLLKGELEKTNEAYALAKIACTKYCQFVNNNSKLNYKTVMPCNVYGPNDNFHSTNSHVMASLIKKFTNAKKLNKKNVVIWGTGLPKREFIFVDDLSRAILKIIQKNFKEDIINIGVGYDITINDLAKKISKILNYNGKIIHDKTKPDGTYRKLLDNSKITKLGWSPTIHLDEGISKTIKWYKANNNL